MHVLERFGCARRRVTDEGNVSNSELEERRAGKMARCQQYKSDTSSARERTDALCVCVYIGCVVRAFAVCACEYGYEVRRKRHPDFVRIIDFRSRHIIKKKNNTDRNTQKRIELEKFNGKNVRSKAKNPIIDTKAEKCTKHEEETRSTRDTKR